MAGNHRRKEAARLRAERMGESFERALYVIRSGVDSEQPGPPTVDLHEYDDIQQIQRLLERRGWELSPYSGDHVDAQGRVVSLEASWDYHAAFDGVPPDDDDDDAPQRPQCHFTWDDDPEWILVGTAGNWGGCDEHRIVETRLPLTEEGIARLPAMLTEVEQGSRHMDPDPLLACTVAGPCGQNVAARKARQQRMHVWHMAMFDTYDNVLTDEQRAELRAWEKDKRNNRAATSDWPGWVPLIGKPPWSARQDAVDSN